MRWESKRLGDYCTVVRGSSPRPKGDVRYYGGEIPRLMVSDVTRDGMYVTPITDFLTVEGAKKSRPMKSGDVVIAVSGDPGEPCILTMDACIHDGFVGLRDLSEVFFKPFLYLYLKYFKANLKSGAVGAIYKNLTTTQIKEIQIPLPPLPIQRQIAELLDTATALRQKTEAQLAELDRLAESVFLDMFGDLINNQKGWKYIEFGKVFKSLRYGTSSPPVYSSLGIPFIRATNIKKGGVAIKGLVYISELEALKIEKCKLNEGDLIIVRSGANTGDCSRIPKEFHGAYGGFDIIVEIDEPHSRFYNFLINTKAGKALLEPLTRRAGQPHLNSKQITEFQVFDITLSLQTHFAQIIENLEAQKAVLRRSLQESEDLVGCLLQEVFA